METMENHGMDAEFNFESALEDYLSTDFGDLEEGTIVKGEIVRVDDDNVLVDVNFKSEGQIPTAEFRDAEGNLVVKVGDRVDVFVARKNEQEGTITLSFEKAKPICSSREAYKCTKRCANCAIFSLTLRFVFSHSPLPSLFSLGTAPSFETNLRIS